MNIWEDVYSKHKNNGRVSVDPQSESLGHPSKPAGSDFLEDAPYKNFCEKGGRFGPHNQHQWQYQDILLHDEDLCFLTYFNSGLRVFDISDDKLVKEVAYFVPPDPLERRGMLPKSKLVGQTEDVLCDARGFIYITDKNHGIYVLRLDR